MKSDRCFHQHNETSFSPPERIYKTRNGNIPIYQEVYKCTSCLLSMYFIVWRRKINRNQIIISAVHLIMQGKSSINIGRPSDFYSYGQIKIYRYMCLEIQERVLLEEILRKKNNQCLMSLTGYWFAGKENYCTFRILQNCTHLHYAIFFA